MKSSLTISVFIFAATVMAADPLKTEDKSSTPPAEKIAGTIKTVVALEALSSIEEIQRVPLTEINIPFLSAELKGQTGIRVRLPPATIKWRETGTPAGDTYLRHATVYLDSDANRVLAIITRLAQRSPDIHDAFAPGVAEQQLKSGSEYYDSFPATPPKVTFNDALEEVRAHGVGSPPLAQEIDGFLLMYSRLGKPPQAAWVIVLRGFPPMPSRQPPPSLNVNPNLIGEQPIWERNIMRNVVDAESGKWLFASNVPFPLDPPVKP